MVQLLLRRAMTRPATIRSAIRPGPWVLLVAHAHALGLLQSLPTHSSLEDDTCWPPVVPPLAWPPELLLEELDEAEEDDDELLLEDELEEVLEVGAARTHTLPTQSRPA